MLCHVTVSTIILWITMFHLFPLAVDDAESAPTIKASLGMYANGVPIPRQFHLVWNERFKAGAGKVGRTFFHHSFLQNSYTPRHFLLCWTTNGGPGVLYSKQFDSSSEFL